MEALPLLKDFLGIALIFVVPFQHFWLVVDADVLAVCFNDARWVVEKVVSVDDANLHFFVLAVAINAIDTINMVTIDAINVVTVDAINVVTIDAVGTIDAISGRAVGGRAVGNRAVGGRAVDRVFASWNLRADMTILHEVVEYAAELVIAGFGGVEFVETGDFVERWDRTSVVGWNGGAGMTDKESEVELL